MQIQRSVARFFFPFTFLVLFLTLTFLTAGAADHREAPKVDGIPEGDITDVFLFTDPNDASRAVLIMNVNPFATPAENPSFSFSPDLLYQFKIDTNGDGVEDQVLQLRPTGAGVNQSIDVFGPSAPIVTGTASRVVKKTGTIAFNDRAGSPLPNGIKVFVGDAKDPFFFDLARFFQILPDRDYQNQPNPGPPDPGIGFQGFSVGNPSGCATTPSQDFLSSNQFNVIAIVAEMPKSMLGGGRIGVWTTTSTTSGH